MSTARLPSYLIPTPRRRPRVRITRIVKQSTNAVIYPRPRSVSRWMLIGAMIVVAILLGLRFL